MKILNNIMSCYISLCNDFMLEEKTTIKISLKSYKEDGCKCFRIGLNIRFLYFS